MVNRFNGLAPPPEPGAQCAVEPMAVATSTQLFGDITNLVALETKPTPSDEQLFSRYAAVFGDDTLSRADFPEEIRPMEGLSADALKAYGYLPLGVEGTALRVAVAPPVNLNVLEALRQFSNLPLKLLLANRDDVLFHIERIYTEDAGLYSAYAEESGLTADAEEDMESIRTQAEDAPVVRLAQAIIAGAADARASDIHLEIYKEQFKVRYRIDGVLHDIESPPRSMFMPVISHIKLRAKMNIAERRLPQDGRIQMRLNNRDIDMRVSTLPTVHGESMVIRLLDQGSMRIGLDMLGMDPAMRASFERYITEPHGMILVTGPTGSGKTTTLYAALQMINTPEQKIITVEDPVEYQIEGINQLAVKPQIELTFASALRSIVRQDPDVIMIGEVRDRETAEIAIQSALTGHLVFSTLHTNDAFGAAHRLMDMGIESYLIASSVLMVLAQRLVRVICPHCKTEITPSELDRLFLESEGVSVGPELRIYKGAGCNHCTHTGYAGRVGIYELLTLNSAVKEAILKKLPAEQIRRVAMAEGGATMRHDGINKVLAGVTTIEELARVTRQDS